MEKIRESYSLIFRDLMQDAKSGHLETSFGGKHREFNVHIILMSNTAPDLSVLIVYRNVIWPCHCEPGLTLRVEPSN